MDNSVEAGLPVRDEQPLSEHRRMLNALKAALEGSGTILSNEQVRVLDQELTGARKSEQHQVRNGTVLSLTTLRAILKKIGVRPEDAALQSILDTMRTTGQLNRPTRPIPGGAEPARESDSNVNRPDRPIPGGAEPASENSERPIPGPL